MKAGYKRKNLSGMSAYYSYVPNSLPKHLDLSEETEQLIKSAHGILHVLNDRSKTIPDMDIFISIYVEKESLLSSEIEGTLATLDDVLNPEAYDDKEVRDVVRLTKALQEGIEKLEKLPLSKRFLQESHGVLLEGVRGQDKNPGEFRRSQNWIGGIGSTIRNASYIPPNVEDMHEALDDLEIFIHGSDDLDPLVKAALIHYQFETIHPFLDGNGRLGRLLVLFYFIDQGILDEPSLYLSYYLKLHRSEYYELLMRVREESDYESFIKFFLKAIIFAGDDAIKRSTLLHKLSEENKRMIHESSYTNTMKKKLLGVFKYMEKRPIFTTNMLMKEMNVSFNSAHGFIERLMSLGLIELTKEVKRNKTYIYEEYVALFRH